MRTEDGYIIQRCLDGDTAAFGLIVDKYRRSIYALAYSKIHNFHDAQDITQEAFIKAYRNLRVLRRWDNFVSWLYRITCNLCIDWLRSNSKRPDREFMEDQEAGAADSLAVDLYHENMVYQSIREALDTLPEMYRQVLTLRYFGGMTIKEMSRFLGVSPATIKRQLKGAQDQLKEGIPAMMNTAYEQHQLPTNSTFHIVELIKHIRFQPFSGPTGISLGLSLAVTIVITVLGLNIYPGILGHTAVPTDSLPSVEAKVSETGEIPVEILTSSEMPAISNWQDGGHGNSQSPGSESTLASVVESQEDYGLDHQDTEGIQNDSDLAAIRRLFLAFEHGYEEHDIEKYISVFSSEEYEYIGDMGTPDNPKDDFHVTRVEEERKSADRVFNGGYEIGIDLKETELKIDGNLAEAKIDMQIVILAPEGRRILPQVLYTTSSNIYSMKKFAGEWKIVRWEQHETPMDELKARRLKEIEDKGVEALIQDLSSDDFMTWGMAAWNLESQEKKESYVALLVEVLQRSEEDAKQRIIWLLSGTKNEAAVNALVEVLEAEENDVGIRAAAAKALTESDDPAVDKALLTAMRKGELGLESAACLALAARLNERARQVRDYAMRVLRSSILSKDETVRREMLKSLGMMLSADGASLLEERLKDREESLKVRFAAIEYLGDMGLASSLGIFRAMLEDRTEENQLRAEAANAIGKADDPLMSRLLIDILEDEEESLEVQKAAVRALGSVEDSDAGKALMAFLGSPDTVLRRGTVISLGQLKYQPALKPLIRILLDKHEGRSIRAHALDSIFAVDQDGAFDALAQIMKDKSEIDHLRTIASYKLAEYSDDRSVQLFLDLLGNKAELPRLRQAAIRYLKAVSHLESVYGNEAYIQALETATGDADKEIAATAQRTLSEIKAKVADDTR